LRHLASAQRVKGGGVFITDLKQKAPVKQPAPPLNVEDKPKSQKTQKPGYLLQER
jgi:hypothetical protein